MQHIIFVAFGSVEFGKKKKEVYHVNVMQLQYQHTTLLRSTPRGKTRNPTFVIFGDWEGGFKAGL